MSAIDRMSQTNTDKRDSPHQKGVPACLSMQSSYFCPVSLGRSWNVLLWVLLGVCLIAATWMNMKHPSPYLFSLYTIPVIIFAAFTVNRWLTAAFAAGVGAIWLYFSGLGWTAWLGAGGLLVTAILLQRIVIVSRNNFHQKYEYEELFMNTILSFSRTIDMRDPYTAFHSNNVARFAKRIAEEMGLSQKDAEAVHLAGLIHDIGKIGTPEAILHKVSGLTEAEYEVMKKHAEDGYQIVKEIKRLQEMGITDMVRHHHERLDGSGYPAGLKGTDIPLGARILAVSDAYDAMTTNRSYRAKLTPETACEELNRYSGTQFDPKAVRAFLSVLKKDGTLKPDGAASGEGVAVLL